METKHFTYLQAELFLFNTQLRDPDLSFISFDRTQQEVIDEHEYSCGILEDAGIIYGDGSDVDVCMKEPSFPSEVN